MTSVPALPRAALNIIKLIVANCCNVRRSFNNGVRDLGQQVKGNSEVLEEEERRQIRSVFACYNNNKMDRYLLPEPLPATGNLPEQWERFKNNSNNF